MTFLQKIRKSKFWGWPHLCFEAPWGPAIVQAPSHRRGQPAFGRGSWLFPKQSPEPRQKSFKAISETQKLDNQNFWGCPNLCFGGPVGPGHHPSTRPSPEPARPAGASPAAKPGTPVLTPAEVLKQFQRHRN